MKAYKISCSNVDSCGECVVFADDRSAARHQDCRDCDCEFIEIKIRRAKEFDDLSPGPVTVRQYLDRGWQYNCC